MQHITGQIHRLLLKKHKTLAVAESCSGGLLSKLLTDMAGSSKYYLLGIVAYSNEAKGKILNIPASTIAQKGAVSQEVADLMANSVRKLARADFGIGVTGIAGPTGGSKAKPVGTVFIAVGSKNINVRKKFIFTGNRLTIRQKAALQALRLLKSYL